MVFGGMLFLFPLICSLRTLFPLGNMGKWSGSKRGSHKAMILKLDTNQSVFEDTLFFFFFLLNCNGSELTKTNIKM